MEELLKQIIARLDRMEEGQQQTNKRYDRIESDLTDLKTTVSNIAGQQRENTEFIKALLHRTEELNAKFEVLNSRLFQQEAAIHQLKAVK